MLPQKLLYSIFVAGLFTSINAFSQEDLPLGGGRLPNKLSFPKERQGSPKSKIPQKRSAIPFFQKKQQDDLQNRGIITAEMQYLKNVKSNTKEFEGNFPMVDQDLGGFSTPSKHLSIYCRDHQAPDGDTVTIYLNDQPIVISVILGPHFQKFTIPLKVGVNHLSFKALNQGESGPNTAEFMVLDEHQNIICQNKWNLATGAKAFLTIARDP